MLHIVKIFIYFVVFMFSWHSWMSVCVFSSFLNEQRVCVSGAVLWLVVRSFVISELVRHPSSAHKNIFSSIRALIEITIYVHTYVHTDTHPCIHTHTHTYTRMLFRFSGVDSMCLCVWREITSQIRWKFAKSIKQ